MHLVIGIIFQKFFLCLFYSIEEWLVSSKCENVFGSLFLKIVFENKKVRCVSYLSRKIETIKKNEKRRNIIKRVLLVSIRNLEY